MNANRLFLGGAIGLVVVAVVAALIAIGSPGHARQLALDATRANDLADISSALNARYALNQKHPQLPARLPRDLVAWYYGTVPSAQYPSSGKRNFVLDPVTDRPYAYQRIDAQHYRLCATFALPTGTANRATDTRGLSLWTHGVGRTCYALALSEDSTGVPTLVQPRR